MASLTFKTSDIYLARLDDVFVDHIVYVDQWSRFMSDCLQEWRRSLFGVSIFSVQEEPMLTYNRRFPDSCAYCWFCGWKFISRDHHFRLHLPFLVLNSPSPALLTASVAVFGSGLASSTLLGHKYEPMQGISATDAVSFTPLPLRPMLNNRTDDVSGHRPLARFQISSGCVHFFASQSASSLGIRVIFGQLPACGG